MQPTKIRTDLIEGLRDQIQRIKRSPSPSGETGGVSTGFAALNALLPDGGLKRGTLLEWLSDSEGSGAVALAAAVASHLLRQEGVLVVVDRTREFYPLAAAALGIPLERTVVVRPDTPMAALWTWEQSLRCPGVTVTLGQIDALDDRLFRRLQLAAETGGGWGFLLRPPDGRSTPSWAATRIGVKAHRRPSNSVDDSDPTPRCLRVWLARGQARCRETLIELGSSHETSDVSLVPQLADSAEIGRSAVG